MSFIFSFQMSDGQYVFIKDIRPGIKNLNVMFIVLEIGRCTNIQQTSLSIVCLAVFTESPDKILLMSTFYYNICFCGEIRKLSDSTFLQIKAP